MIRDKNGALDRPGLPSRHIFGRKGLSGPDSGLVVSTVASLLNEAAGNPNCIGVTGATDS